MFECTTTLPFWVKPYSVEIMSVKGSRFGVKIKCFLPITLLNTLKETQYFDINNKKSYLGNTNIINKNIDSTFILTGLLPLEQVYKFNTKTKIRIARWK